jgi:ABC-type antimicrobial peptide transport system permease subunit
VIILRQVLQSAVLISVIGFCVGVGGGIRSIWMLAKFTVERHFNVPIAA